MERRSPPRLSVGTRRSVLDSRPPLRLSPEPTSVRLPLISRMRRRSLCFSGGREVRRGCRKLTMSSSSLFPPSPPMLPLASPLPTIRTTGPLTTRQLSSLPLRPTYFIAALPPRLPNLRRNVSLLPSRPHLHLTQTRSAPSPEMSLSEDESSPERSFPLER